MSALARRVNANAKPAQSLPKLPDPAHASECQLAKFTHQLTLICHFQLWRQGKGQHLRVSNLHKGVYE